MLDTINLPSENECFELMNHYNMLPNIVDHSIQVMRVAMVVANHLIDQSLINIPLLKAGALLHDIAKTISIQNNDRRHDLIGGEILRQHGYVEIAIIVESHVILNDFNHHGPLEEREIVHYADKRVMHDVIVTLDERIEDLCERYGKNDEIKILIKENLEFLRLLESKIQRFISKDIEFIIQTLQ